MEANDLVNAFVKEGCRFFTGVPDSLLTKFSACVMQRSDVTHLIAANEGNAVGLAIGEYLATGAPAVVYMQNSGLGNAVNPIASLADPDVYGIPIFLVIGWRGEPGIHDEPQHVKQGEITPGLLNVLGIPFAILSKEANGEKAIAQLWSRMKERKGPVALLVRKGAIEGEYKVEKKPIDSEISREEAINALLQSLPKEAFLVATTGKTGRELYELREKRNEVQRDFLTVGGMGHASSITLGVALQHPERWCVCLDGDGAALMHLGAMATIASTQPKRYLHIVLNNAAHESVGGQPTVADQIGFKKLSESLGYTGYRFAKSEDEIRKAVNDITAEDRGCWLLEILVKQGSRSDLGRPKKSPKENKDAVMNFLFEGKPC